MDKNLLYYGDNLEVLRHHVTTESVDLVYLDPPFNSNATYNVLFGEHDTKAAAQIQAFEDTWRWDEVAARTWEETVESGGRVAQAMRAFRTLLGTSDMLAYLSMMAPRLVELHRTLKRTGSLYLHCDPTASHYLKLLLDAVFDPRDFRNEVIWRRTGSKGDARRKFGSVHDVLLVYGKSAGAYFEVPRTALRGEYAARFDRDDGDGRGPYHGAPLDSPSPRPNLTYEYKGYPPPAKGWRVDRAEMERLDREGRLIFPADPKGRIRRKLFLAEALGSPVSDVWTDIDPINSQAQERLGYPTQKPEALLERIVEASSKPGDVVLDPFCGCGTAIAVAQRTGRHWIGIDITHLSVNLIRHRLKDAYGADIAKTYRVIGEPTTVEDAAQLAQDDPYQFQWWALSLVGAPPAEQKKGADKGVDGRIFFHDEAGKTKEIILSVKAGKVGRRYVHELRGVVEREGAQIGVLLSLHEPTRAMREDAADSGFYHSPYQDSMHPRIQLLTVGELLGGKEIDYPHMTAGRMFRRAPKHAVDAATPPSLFDPVPPD